MTAKQWAGIDIAKSELVVGVYPVGETRKFANSAHGRAELEAYLSGKSPELVVMESSGDETVIMIELSAAGFAVSSVNPRQVRDFAKAIGVMAKTDEIDAMVIARFAEAVKPPVRRLRDETEAELKSLIARRRQLVSMLCDEKNRLMRSRVKSIVKEINSHISWLEKRIKDIDGGIDVVIQENPVWRETEELLREVPGVGPVLSKTLIIELPELGRIGAKQVVSLVGVAPINRDSGCYRGERHIHGGRKAVRRTLYICTIAAIRFNECLREFYLRLVNAGKKAKVAIVACMRKFLTILNAMVKNRTHWQYSPA